MPKPHSFHHLAFVTNPLLRNFMRKYTFLTKCNVQHIFHNEFVRGKPENLIFRLMFRPGPTEYVNFYLFMSTAQKNISLNGLGKYCGAFSCLPCSLILLDGSSSSSARSFW